MLQSNILDELGNIFMKENASSFLLTSIFPINFLMKSELTFHSVCFSHSFTSGENCMNLNFV